jgi:hypothetical protein
MTHLLAREELSTLWAPAEPTVAAQVENADRAASTPRWPSQHALFSSTGANGVRQVRPVV